MKTITLDGKKYKLTPFKKKKPKELKQPGIADVLSGRLF